MQCDVCKHTISAHYVDGRIFWPDTTISRWGYACIPCWRLHGCGHFALGHARLYTPTNEPVPHRTANDPNYQKGIGLL